MKVNMSNGEKQELLPKDDKIVANLERIVLKDESSEEELKILKLIMDVQNTDKEVIDGNSLNIFRNSLIRCIYKIKEKGVMVLETPLTSTALDYSKAPSSGSKNIF